VPFLAENPHWTLSHAHKGPNPTTPTTHKGLTVAQYGPGLPGPVGHSRWGEWWVRRIPVCRAAARTGPNDVLMDFAATVHHRGGFLLVGKG